MSRAGPRRVLAAVGFDAGGHETARTAWAIARRSGARLGLGHVADWDIGGDDFTPLTPAEIEERLAVVVRRKLAAMAARLGAAETATAVAFAGAGRGLGDLVRNWQPDLLVVGSRHDHGLADRTRLAVPGWACDVLVVETAPSGWWRGIVDLVAETMPPGRTARAR